MIKAKLKLETEQRMLVIHYKSLAGCTHSGPHIPRKLTDPLLFSHEHNCYVSHSSSFSARLNEQLKINSFRAAGEELSWRASSDCLQRCEV